MFSIFQTNNRSLKIEFEPENIFVNNILICSMVDANLPVTNLANVKDFIIIVIIIIIIIISSSTVVKKKKKELFLQVFHKIIIAVDITCSRLLYIYTYNNKLQSTTQLSF